MSEISKAMEGLHKKIDAGTSRIHGRLDDVVTSIGDLRVTQERSITELEQLKADKPCAEVRAARRDIDSHAEEHKSMRNRIIGWILSVTGVLAAAYLLIKLGLNNG